MQQWLEGQVRPKPQTLMYDILIKARQHNSKGKREDTRAGKENVPVAPAAVWLSEILAPVKVMATLNSGVRTQNCSQLCAVAKLLLPIQSYVNSKEVALKKQEKQNHYMITLLPLMP